MEVDNRTDLPALDGQSVREMELCAGQGFPWPVSGDHTARAKRTD